MTKADKNLLDYMSDTFEKLSDVETGLYLEGAAYVYEMLKREGYWLCF